MTDEKTPRWKEKLTELAANKTYRTILVIVGLGLIGLIFLSGFWEKQPAVQADTAPMLEPEESVSSYAAQLEEHLTAMLSNMKGVGAVQVMVTIEKGVEQIYATEEKTSKQVTNNHNSGSDTRNQENDDTETTYILLKDADGGQKAIAVTQIQPIVKGVVVVCEGGGNSTVERQIIDAVTTALDISSTKVCVVNAK